MKSYTDIEQSKKLSEILLSESADMYHFVPADNEGEFIEKVNVIEHKSCYNLFYKVTDWDDTPYIPCWSLAALLNVIPIWYDIHPTKSHVAISCDYGEEVAVISDNLVDACVEMILKLHKLNLL